jgi:sirohydrochlorin cobaltochelatase
MRERLPQYDVESGFLEFARPTIQEGLKKLMERGVTEILAAPAILFAAGHVKNDIPWELNSFAASHPVLSLSCGRDLSIEPKLLMAARDRIQAAMETAGGGVAAADTLLMVVGRGTNDPDANSNVSKVARMLWEGMDLGWAETCYSGVAHPRVDKGLERVAAMSFQRIIVFPYFLFTGVLVKRIYAQMAEVASKYPGTEFVAASYLNDHPRVLDTLAERVTGITEGDNAMNCLLCKYREQVVGFEDAQGQPQAGHHHHVRGIGTGHDHDHAHDHGPAKEPA